MIASSALRRGAAAACAATCLLAAASWRGGADAQSAPTFVQPAERRSANGVLRTTLEMKLGRNQLADRTIETSTYEGTIPGPTLRVKPGDTLFIRLINNLRFPGAPLPLQRLVTADDVLGRTLTMMRSRGHAAVEAGHGAAPDPLDQLNSNIHTHGLQVSAAGNSDNPFLLFSPGETFDYEIRIPHDQPAGTYWYHPHKHGSTSKQAWAGMAGAIIVEGDVDRAPFVAVAEEKVMVLHELWVDHEGHVPAGVPIPVAGHHDHAPFSSIPAVPSDIYYTVNGVYRPTLTIQPGQTQRWRIINAAPHRFFKLALDGHTLHQIAQDGLTIARPRASADILVAPGNRVDLMIRGGAPGTYTLRALEYEQGHPGGPMPEEVLATIVSEGISLRNALPARLPAPEPDIRGLPIDRRRTVVFRGSTLTAPVQFFLDDKAFDPGRVDAEVTVGTVEEWTLENRDVFQHPFHIHVNPFMVVEVNGRAIENPIWWDTIGLPPLGRVKILMKPRTDITGQTVYHCHILPHEDNGMMSVVSLVK